MPFTLHKNERLTSRTLIEQLFRGNGTKAVNAFPLRAVYATTERHADDAPMQMMASVSKRHFKRAVKRNRVKRQIREAYRLNKSLLPTPPDGQQLIVAFIWLADTLYPSTVVHEKMVKAMKRIKDER